MYERKTKEDLDCGITVAMKVFGAKWKPCIIDAISRGIQRPSELHRAISTSARVIDMQLSELVTYGVVVKTVHANGFPLYVEYTLTPLGESILPILEQLNAWGLKNKAHVQQINQYQSAQEQPAAAANCLQPA